MSKPFFPYLPYNAPHYPLHAWPQDIAKYKGRYDAGWDAIRAARFEKQIATAEENWMALQEQLEYLQAAE